MPASKLVRVSGTWWRQGAPGIDPLSWQEPAPDARWQRGSVTGALYLAESPETAWAEFYRALAEAAVPPRVALPRDLIELCADFRDIADLSTAKALEAEGLPIPGPAQSEWPSFQKVGEGLFKDGAAGLIAPSAARDGGKVLCLFRNGPGPTGLTVESTELFTDPPVVPQGLRT